MGTYAKTNITVEFDEAVSEELGNIDNLLKDYVGKDNYINPFNIEIYENNSILTFELDSSRSVNLEWQVLQTLQFFRESDYKILTFSSDAYTQMESACIFVDEEDFAGYYEEL